MTAQRTNRRMLNIARALELDAPNTQAALDHLALEATRIELWPTATNGDGMPRGADTTTQPEREIVRIDTIREKTTTIHQLLEALDGCRRDLRDYCHQILTQAKAPTPPPRCDGRQLDGYIIALDDGGWSDPTCREIPRRGDSGPCDKCYQRHRRWRQRRGLRPLNDTEPAR